MNMIRLTVLLLSITLISGCGLIRGGLAYFQSTDSFIELDSSGIFYEQGSQEIAIQVNQLLPAAIATVEHRQRKPFKDKAAIYICLSKESFSKYSGASELARGAVFNQKLFLSPRAVESQTLNTILIHELSHLHFHQYVGNRRYASNIPPWFQEGLAVYVSEGGGAENVTEKTAKQSLLNGQSFIPHTSASLVFPKTAFSFGLKPHMFYRQSSMFVRFLDERYQAEFQHFLSMLFDDVEFSHAFDMAFNKSINQVWQEFINTLKTE